MTRKPNITERLRMHAEATPDRMAYTFLRDDGKIDEITFKALHDETRCLAAALLARSSPQSRAVLLYPSGLDFIRAFFACMYAGIVAVPAAMPHKSRPSGRLQALLESAKPDLVLTRSDCETAVNASLSLIEAVGRNCLSTDNLTQGGDFASPMALDGGSTAFLQYTSGSTAEPRGVEITHDNIASNVDAISSAFRFTQSSVMVSWLPLFHDMGLIGSVLAPLYVGFRSVLMSPNTFLMNPFGWLEAISIYRGTCAGSPNFGWDLCVKRSTLEQKSTLDLSSLAVAYNGSEPVRAETLRNFYTAFAKYGLQETALFPCYGMAEATLFVSGSAPESTPTVLTVSKSLLEGNHFRNADPGSEDAKQIVSAGRVQQSFSLEIVDPETGDVCQANRVGEVWLSGDSIAKGYWNRPEDTERTFGARLSRSGKGPFLRTGDLGFLEAGELFITGRLKDLIIINGRNIYPQDIEQMLECSIDFIEPNMCAAFSVDMDGRESLAIVAEADRSLVRAAQMEEKERAKERKERGSRIGKTRAKSGYLVEIERMAQSICQVIAQQLDVSVSSIVFVKPGTFPRTTSGKVQRIRCKELAIAGGLDVVYVMPGSLLDRRDRRGIVQPLPKIPPVPASRQAEFDVDRSAAAHVDNDADASGSRAAADEMIEWFRKYAARRLNSRIMDERRTVTPSAVLDLGNQGFFGLQVPKQFGGRELKTVDLARVLEQLAAVDLSLATLVGVHNGLGVRPILGFGTKAVLGELIPSLASGRLLAAFALTESGAGSNPLAIQATAVKVGGGWLLNGKKQWIGLGSWAGVITVIAKAIDESGRREGTVALAVRESTCGLSYGPEALTMGMRGIVQNTICLNDAFVPDEAALGKVGDGMLVARDAMTFSRFGIGAMCVGAMKRCAQLMARYAANRHISTGRLADNAVTVAKLQNLTSAIYATECLVYQLAALIDGRAEVPAEAYLACKTEASELLGEATDDLVQLLGGRGYVETNIAPQMFRDARVLRILEGPSEALYGHLGASLLRHSASIVNLISSVLVCPQVASDLLASVEKIRIAAITSTGIFGSEAAAKHWLEYRCGQLAATAIMLAATERTVAQDRDTASQRQRALIWLANRFGKQVRETLGEVIENGTFDCRGDVLGHIGAYSRAIGDVTQELAGEEQSLDPLLGELGRASVEHSAAQIEEIAMPLIAESLKIGKRRPTAVIEPDPADGLQSESGLQSGKRRVSPVEAIVSQCLSNWLQTERKVNVGVVDLDASFSSFGMDSLGMVALVLELDQSLGVELAPELVNDCGTVRELARYLEANFVEEMVAVAEPTVKGVEM